MFTALSDTCIFQVYQDGLRVAWELYGMTLAWAGWPLRSKGVIPRQSRRRILAQADGHGLSFSLMDRKKPPGEPGGSCMA